MLCGVLMRLTLRFPTVVSTAAGAQAFMKKGQWEDAEDAMPLPGDIVFFDFPGDNINRVSHVGIVVKDNGDGTVNVMEGNTSQIRRVTSATVEKSA
jgi:cell wall-associated NlpC family hydrolase